MKIAQKFLIASVLVVAIEGRLLALQGERLESLLFEVLHLESGTPWARFLEERKNNNWISFAMPQSNSDSRLDVDPAKPMPMLASGSEKDGLSIYIFQNGKLELAIFSISGISKMEIDVVLKKITDTVGYSPTMVTDDRNSNGVTYQWRGETKSYKMQVPATLDRISLAFYGKNFDLNKMIPAGLNVRDLIGEQK